MYGNWARCTTTTPGTGNLTISSVSLYPTVNDVMGLVTRFGYSILLDSDGTPIECGIGYLSASTTMVRETILGTYVSGTFDQLSGTPVTLASGTKRVICTPLSQTLAPPLPAVGSSAGNPYITNGAVGVAMTGFFDGLDTSGRFNVFPWFHNFGGKVDAFVANCTTAQSGKIMRCGLYTVKANGDPGDLIVEGSTSMSLATTGIKTATFTTRIVPPGWYYIAEVSDATTAAIEGSGSLVASQTYLRTLPWGQSGTTCGTGGYALGVSTSAMPTTSPSLSGISTNLKVANILMRAA